MLYVSKYNVMLVISAEVCEYINLRYFTSVSPCIDSIYLLGFLWGIDEASLPSVTPVTLVPCDQNDDQNQQNEDGGNGDNEDQPP